MRGEDEQQSNGVPENLPTIRVVKDRSAYKDQHARIIIVARSKKLQLKAGYIYADCSSSTTHVAATRRTIQYRRCALFLRFVARCSRAARRAVIACISNSLQVAPPIDADDNFRGVSQPQAV